MYCIVLIGPTGDDDLLRPRASWPSIEALARGPRQDSRQAAGSAVALVYWFTHEGSAVPGISQTPQQPAIAKTICIAHAH